MGEGRVWVSRGNRRKRLRGHECERIRNILNIITSSGSGSETESNKNPVLQLQILGTETETVGTGIFKWKTSGFTILYDIIIFVGCRLFIGQ